MCLWRHFWQTDNLFYFSAFHCSFYFSLFNNLLWCSMWRIEENVLHNTFVSCLHLHTCLQAFVIISRILFSFLFDIFFLAIQVEWPFKGLWQRQTSEEIKWIFTLTLISILKQNYSIFCAQKIQTSIELNIFHLN